MLQSSFGTRASAFAALGICGWAFFLHRDVKRLEQMEEFKSKMGETTVRFVPVGGFFGDRKKSGGSGEEGAGEPKRG